MSQNKVVHAWQSACEKSTTHQSPARPSSPCLKPAGDMVQGVPAIARGVTPSTQASPKLWKTSVKDRKSCGKPYANSCVGRNNRMLSRGRRLHDAPLHRSRPMLQCRTHSMIWTLPRASIRKLGSLTSAAGTSERGAGPQELGRGVPGTLAR